MINSPMLQGGVAVSDVPHQWTYRLTVITEDGEAIEMAYPLTLSFNILRDTQASSNTATFSILNVAASKRTQVFKDRLDTGIIKGIIFEAGYEGNLTTLFRGNIQEAYSVRHGVDIALEIQAWDVGIGYDYLATTFEAGTTFKEAYKNIVSQSPFSLGSIGALDGQFQQPTTFVGSPLNVLNEITGGHTYVDNGVVNTLQDNECLDAGVAILNADSGLLGSPRRRNAQVEVDSIFRPDILVGQLLEIESDSASEFSGTYVVLGVNHVGEISGAKAGNRKTVLNLMNGKQLKDSPVPLTKEQGEPFTKVKGEERLPVNSNYGSSVREVYRYIREHNGEIVGYNKKINPRVSWIEMLGHGNKPNERLKECTEAVLYNCQTTANKLYGFLQTYFPNEKIEIVSGWRSTANNNNPNRADGVQGSKHIFGQAMDFHFMHRSTRLAYQKFKDYWQGYVYLNKYGNIHVQTTGSNVYRKG